MNFEIDKMIIKIILNIIQKNEKIMNSSGTVFFDAASKVKSVENIYACNFRERFSADFSRSRFFVSHLHKGFLHIKVILSACSYDA